MRKKLLVMLLCTFAEACTERPQKPTTQPQVAQAVLPRFAGCYPLVYGAWSGKKKNGMPVAYEGFAALPGTLALDTLAAPMPDMRWAGRVPGDTLPPRYLWEASGDTVSVRLGPLWPTNTEFRFVAHGGELRGLIYLFTDRNPDEQHPPVGAVTARRANCESLSTADTQAVAVPKQRKDGV